MAFVINDQPYLSIRRFDSKIPKETLYSININWEQYPEKSIYVKEESIEL